MKVLSRELRITFARAMFFKSYCRRTFEMPCPSGGFSIYRALKIHSPAPYHFFLDFGEVQIAGASPEKLISVSNGIVESNPYCRNAADRQRSGGIALGSERESRTRHAGRSGSQRSGRGMQTGIGASRRVHANREVFPCDASRVSGEGVFGKVSTRSMHFAIPFPQGR